MASLSAFTFGTSAALTVMPLSFASPLSWNDASILKTRKFDSWHDCDSDQQAKLEQDFKDAAMYADYAAKNMKRESNAYQHYVRDDDWEHVKGMFEAVAKYSGDDYKFSITCAPKDDKECASRTSWSYAITDAQPEENGVAREMKICPKYFTDDQTKQSSNTDDKTYKPNPGRRDKSWCILPPFKLKNFMVEGQTLLHELTHLDGVGVTVGYPEFTNESPSKYHGTDDIDADNNNFNNPPKDARDLKKRWDDNDHEGFDEPWRNAENIAALALEFWVFEKCEYSDINV